MLKSVTKWLGVSNTAQDTEIEEGKQKEATERKEKENANAAPADDSSNDEGKTKLPAEIKNESKAGGVEVRAQSTPAEEETKKDKATSSSPDVTGLPKLENATSVAVDTAKQVGSALYNFGRVASSTVVEQASKLRSAVQEKGLLGSFSQEQEKLVSEKRVLRKLQEDAVAPWVGYNEEAVMREEILSLSADRRHFLKDPPPEVTYEFDFTSAYPVALATLREDANLRNMRFQLVPKRVSEERFWRNYFYRVSLIKQSVQLKSLEQQQKEGPSSSTRVDPDADPDDRPVTLTPRQPPDTHVRPDTKKEPSTGVEVTPSKVEDEEEEEVGEDWERVQAQDVEDYVTVEGRGGGGGGGAAGQRGSGTHCQEEEEEEEAEDLLLQIEQETSQAQG